MWRSLGQQRLSALVQSGTRQQDIAAACGVAPSTVSRWIAGTTVPTGARALAALAALGVSLDAWGGAPRPVAIDLVPEVRA